MASTPEHSPLSHALRSTAVATRFAIGRRLGAGGQGEVYEALDRLTNTPVAFKLLRADRRPDQGRLREEFTLLATLHHPGVVRVHDFGVVDGRPYLATRLVEGQRLDDWLAGDPSADIVAGVLADLLATLAWLAGQGVLHGDIKPGNILLHEPEGVRPWPVLIDFGLAREQEGAESLGGTRGYEAPEVTAGGAPTPRSELFALGRCFTPWAGRHPGGLSDLIARLAMASASERPAGPAAALRDEAFVVARVERRPRLGSRGLGALWRQPLEQLATAVLAGDGAHHVRLPTSDDAETFAVALHAELAARGLAPLRVPARLARGGDVWSAVAAALGHALPVQGELAPEDLYDGLEVRAAAVCAGLAAAPARPVLLLSAAGGLTDADRRVLTRVVDAHLFPAVVVVDVSGVGADVPGAATVDVPAPDRAGILELLSGHAIPTPTADLLDRLLARARAGATAVRILLDVWADRGILVSSEAGTWTWTADPSGAIDLDTEGPDLDALWRALWRMLPADGQRLVALMVALGGDVAPAALEPLGLGAPPELVERLVVEGWAVDGWDHTAERSRLLLSAGALRRWTAGLFDSIGLDEATRHLLIGVLDSEPATPARLAAVAGHHEALGARSAAAQAWLERSRLLAAKLDPLGSGDAALRGGRLLLADGDDAAALDALDDAVRLLEAAGASDRLTPALVAAREAATRLADPGSALRVLLLQARVAVHTGRPRDALATVEEAAADLEQADARSRLHAELARGTALSQLGRPAAAARALSRAADLAASSGDEHGLGRVSNNLGIAWFHAGDFAGAAEAWRRSADAKRRTGDRRGERIATSNRGLALRELGRVVEAADAAGAALGVAREMGDRRGAAMGHLSLAQLWLDLGALGQAEQELVAFRTVPSTSSQVSLDGRIVAARLRLARGEASPSAREAGAVRDEAAAQELGAAHREAAGLAYVAATLVGEDSPPVPEGDEPLLAACRCHAAALAGEWPLARRLLASLTGTSDVGGAVAPARVPGLGLLGRAAALTGDSDALTGLRAAAERTVSARHAAAVELLGSLAPERQEVADRLDLNTAAWGTVSVELATVPAHDAAPDSGDGRLLASLGTDGMSDPGRWATALRLLFGASGCHLYASDGGSMRLLHGTDLSARWADVAARVAGSGQPYEAGGPDGIEALGLPLSADPSEGAIGALFLSWSSSGAGNGAAAVGAAVPASLALLGVVVDRHRGRWALSSTREALARLKVAHDNAVTAHRDEVTALREALEQSRSDLSLRHDYSAIVHQSSGMQRVLRTVDKVSDRDIPVLLLGDSGVGKELIAGTIHAHGPRRGGPFVAENCGAIPADLFESVFFGHVRGAFTGAHAAREGLVAGAHGGTLFLDEIGELRPEHQVKLLRVLQERTYRPLGGVGELPADFRLVAATNRDLEEMVAAGTFREDLYYRVAVVTVRIPPLRDRPDDVLPLATRLLARHAEQLGRPLRLGADAANALVAWEWPGNVRELDNEMLRASVLCEGETIELEHLSLRVRGTSEAADPAAAMRHVWSGDEQLDAVVGRVEQHVILEALRANRGMKAATARALGLSRPGLDGKIGRYGIDAASIRQQAKGTGARS